MLCLELSTLISEYPDIKGDCTGTRLATQGDTCLDMKSATTEALEQGLQEGEPGYAPVFKGLTALSLNMG